jgi:hypothetical protein
MNEYDKILDELLIKYHYYESCPDFLKFVQAKELIPDVVKRIQNYEKITVISLKQEDQKVIQPYLSELSDRIDYMDLKFPLQEKDILHLNNATEGKQSIVLLVSFYFYREFVIELHKAGIEYVSLYEYFTIRGLCFSREFYSYQPVIYDFPEAATSFHLWMQPSNEHHLFFLYKNRYEQTFDDQLREFYLRALIFVCIDMRDFIYASKYLVEYRSFKQEKLGEIFEIEKTISKCIKKIQSKLHERQHKDLILFWIDSLEYGDDAQMPFLHEQASQGITFENAYTVTPFTNPTLRTILCEKTVIDDQCYKIEEIGIENSRIIRTLEEKGYSFSYYGFMKGFCDEYKGKLVIEWGTPQTRIYWSAIGDFMFSEKPVCTILHEILSTHDPYISNAVEDAFYYCKSLLPIEREQLMEQKRRSAKYTDEQIRFYSSLLPKQARKFYFGDHGSSQLGRFHPFFTIQWEGCPSYVVSGLFSYIDFSKLLIEIIEDRVENLNLLCTDYVMIQDVDIYQQRLVEMSIHTSNYNPQNGLSYRGIVNKDSVFIRYRDGSERYWRTVADKVFFTEEELSNLRELAGEKFLEPENDPKFEYSMRFIRLANHYKNRTGSYEERKLTRIKELFTQEFASKKIAIRGGGFTTFRFLLWANVNNSISFIVDLDKNALAGKLGFKILTPQEAYERPIDLIITLHEGMYANAQSESWTCPIMDLLAFGKAEGILTTEHYGNWAITAEDIEASR